MQLFSKFFYRHHRHIKCHLFFSFFNWGIGLLILRSERKKEKKEMEGSGQNIADFQMHF